MSNAIRCQKPPRLRRPVFLLSLRCAFICDACARTQEDGAIVCPTCYQMRNSPRAIAGIAVPPVSAMAPAIPSGVKCKTHPEVDAVARCAECRAAVCADDAISRFPAAFTSAPAYATNPKQKLSRSAESSRPDGPSDSAPATPALLRDRRLLHQYVPAPRMRMQLIGCFVMGLPMIGIIGFILGSHLVQS